MARTDEAAPNRVPPHNLEAEDAVLGAVLLSSDAAELARAVLGDTGDFYRPSNRDLWATITALSRRGVAIDQVTVAAELTRAGLDYRVGGWSRLLELTAGAPGTGNVIHYARIVKDLGIARHVIGQAAAIVEEGYGGPADVAAYVSRSQERLINLNGHTPTELGHNIRIADIAALIAGGIPRVDPDIWTRTDGACLMYAGKMHMLQAEPSAGKSWLALTVARELLELGGAVLYLDLEDSDVGILSRLIQVGAPGDSLVDRFGYVALDGPYGHAEARALGAELDRLNPDLVVIDGVAEALVREGLDENAAADFVRWIEKLPRPLSKTGAAVLMLDHVKRDSPGRWARGTTAKLGALDGIAYSVHVVESFSRSKAGKVRLKVAKDRPGGVGAPGESVADIDIVPQADGAYVSITVSPHVVPTSPDGVFEPTRAMAAVSAILERHPDGLRARAIRDELGGRFQDKIAGQAIRRLVALEHVRQQGAPSAALYRLLKPYHDPTPDPPTPPAPTAPQPPDELFDNNVTDLEAWKDRNL